MMLFTVLAFVYLALMLFPFFLARSALEPSKARSLVVKDDNVRDPRYFPKAFVALMEHALTSYDGDGTIRLSKPETLLEPPLPDGDLISAVVYARGDFVPVGARTFEKEIYCRGNGALPAQTMLRAIACRGALAIGEGCELARWADGEASLTVSPGCRLGISASSGARLSVAKDCTFRRLYAPEIRVGEPVLPAIDPPPVPLGGEIHRDTGDIEDFGIIEGDVVAMDSLTIGEGAEIRGSIKSRKHVHVKRGARILGNLVSNGNLVLERDVFIGGVVFSQSWAYIGPDCQIGRAGRIKSVVARDGVVLAEGARVFGYVGGERDGRTVAAEEFISVIGDKY